MDWLALNWPLVLGWVLYAMSEAMPYLPGKAQNVMGTLVNIIKAILGVKPKAALPPSPGAK